MKLTRDIIRNLIKEEIQKEGFGGGLAKFGKAVKTALGPRDAGTPASGGKSYELWLTDGIGGFHHQSFEAPDDEEAKQTAGDHYNEFLKSNKDAAIDTLQSPDGKILLGRDPQLNSYKSTAAAARR